MAKFEHVVSGARVEVRDDKVMDSSWKPTGDTKAASKTTAKKTTAASSTKSES